MINLKKLPEPTTDPGIGFFDCSFVWSVIFTDLTFLFSWSLVFPQFFGIRPGRPFIFHSPFEEGIAESRIFALPGKVRKSCGSNMRKAGFTAKKCADYLGNSVKVFEKHYEFDTDTDREFIKTG